MKMIGLFLIAVVVSFANIACMGCTNIEPGHVGVEINKCSGGGVNNNPLGVGYHFYGACTDIIEYPVFQQTMVLAKAGTEAQHSNGFDDALDVNSSEGMIISTDTSISYTVDAHNVPGIYNKFKQNLEHIQSTYIKQTIRSALTEVFNKYTAQEIVSNKKGVARDEAERILKGKLHPDGFVITQFTLNATRPPQGVIDAINAKVAMSQDAQRSEQEVRKITAQAAQAVAKAKGEADATKLRADAEAYYNEKVSKSLTPAYVQYLNAKKWDGKLPTMTGGAIPFINMKD